VAGLGSPTRGVLIGEESCAHAPTQCLVPRMSTSTWYCWCNISPSAGPQSDRLVCHAEPLS
jgi:hypothetical protein